MRLDVTSVMPIGAFRRVTAPLLTGHPTHSRPGPALLFAAGTVLVHCAQGISRSASILIGYLMSREQLPYDTALAQLQAARPVVQPNPGFALQLQEFGRSGCCLESWSGWDAARLDDSFAQVSHHNITSHLARHHSHLREG
jgi:hypothetical protein